MDTISIREKILEVPTREANRLRTSCFACDEGVLYIGRLIPLPDGDEEEVYTARRCRLCDGTGQIRR